MQKIDNNDNLTVHNLFRIDGKNIIAIISLSYTVIIYS